METKIFVPVDSDSVHFILYKFLQTAELQNLMDTDNVNINRDLTGQDLLMKAVICSLVYEEISGFSWLTVHEPQVKPIRWGTEVTFETEADAVAWKISKGGN